MDRAKQSAMPQGEERSGIAQALARVTEFTLGPEPLQVPPAVQERTALQLLDTLGIAIAAQPMQAGVIARNTAALIYGAGESRHSARMLLDGRRVSLAGAAYATASQIDNLDGHDGYNPTKGHIGVVVLPALLALADAGAEMSGPEALAAAIVGYEVAGRAGIALHATVSDYHTSGAWNALGVAAMAARARKHTPAMLRESLGIAEYHGPRSQMMREIATPTMLHDGSGWGALSGLSAAVLAEQGFTGAPAVTVEHPDVAHHWDDLGRFWQVERQYIKPYPTCRWGHAAIDAARELKLRHGFSHNDVAEVRVKTFTYAAELFRGMPDSTSKAQYSLAFAVAAMLVNGRIGLEHISGAGLRDPEVASLVARTVLLDERRHQARYPEGRWSDVDILLKDGSLLSSGDVHARGGPERPFSRDEIIAKYMEFAAPVIGERRGAAIRDAMLGLSDPESRFADAASLLYGPP